MMLCQYVLSSQVISHYKEEGFDFLLKAFNMPNYLEDLTGLSQLFSETLDDQVPPVLIISQYVLVIT